MKIMLINLDWMQKSLGSVEDVERDQCYQVKGVHGRVNDEKACLKVIYRIKGVGVGVRYQISRGVSMR